MIAPDPEEIDFEKGLVPAVIRDVRTGATLMLAFMNREAYENTLASGETCFWSRSRGKLWRKGETSGNVQKVRSIRLDCDGDSLLIDVEPAGPACHTGDTSCFGDQQPERLDLQRLEATMIARKQERPEGSYVASLFAAGTDRILRKVAEETTEVILAAKGEGRERLIEEASDLLVHLTALLVNEDVSLAEVAVELRRRER